MKVERTESAASRITAMAAGILFLYFILQPSSFVSTTSVDNFAKIASLPSPASTR